MQLNLLADKACRKSKIFIAAISVSTGMCWYAREGIQQITVLVCNCELALRCRNGLHARYEHYNFIGDGLARVEVLQPHGKRIRDLLSFRHNQHSGVGTHFFAQDHAGMEIMN